MNSFDLIFWKILLSQTVQSNETLLGLRAYISISNNNRLAYNVVQSRSKTFRYYRMQLVLVASGHVVQRIVTFCHELFHPGFTIGIDADVKFL